MKETVLWVCLFIANSILPITVFLGGLYFMKFPPKRTNPFAYRTSRSMLTEETWKFAQSCCGILWEMLGIATLVPTWMISILAYFMTLKQQCITSFIVVTIQLVLFIVVTLSVDRAIKRNFDDVGNRMKYDKNIETNEEEEEKEITMKEILFGISKEEDE